MDTPQKTQIGNPAYDFEESPFSNFINNLSPINPSNSIPVSQTLGALTFTSPPSVFTSPHVTLQKDSTFLRRHQVSELSKPELASDTESKDVTREDAGNAANSPRKGSDEVKDAGPSKDKDSEDAPDESSNLAIELPTELKYDCGSPDIQTTSEPGASSSVPLFQEASSGNSLGTHLASVETDENMDGSGGDWGLIDTADLLVFESPQVQEPPKDSEDHSLDEQIDLFASYLSQFPEGEDVNDMEHQHGLSPLSSDVQDQMSQSGPAANKLHQIYHGQDYNGSSSSNVNVPDQISKNLENKVIVHRGIRRRCLVFEIPGAKKNVGGSSISTSSSQDEANILANSAVSALNQGGDSSMCVRPGIGLHLNTLSVSSNGGRVLIPENFSSEKQLITVPPTAVSESFKSSASISLEEIGNSEKEVEVAEDASQASAPGSNEDLNPNSPKKKRRRSENSGEGDGSCKRCNCKKSKCLKLYCECFAAGVYCVEPCACRDCFNKPIHEETVLATRKQIESRNPLAFAPKVIRSDNVNDPGDESNKTPASARHKRGCNCKKSNCLKKYCECYQGGVGCSVNCRCEGCKNTFGRKDGPTFAGMELEVEEDTPAHEKVQPGIHNDEDLNPGSKLPQTPLRLFRPSIPLPSSSKGKPSRFVSVSSCSLLNPDGPGRSTFLRAQHKIDNKQPQEASSVDKLPAFLHNTSPSSNTIKTLSPNSKRISSPHNDNIRTSPGTRSTSRKLILQSIPSFPSLTPRR